MSRHSQFPSASPGRFILASSPRPSRSCKGKLEYTHTRKSKAVAQFMNFVCNYSQVLGDKREGGKVFLEGVEKVISRPFLPSPFYGVRFRCWYLPVIRKAPE